MPFITSYPSPLGDIILTADGAALTGLWFQGQKYFPDLAGALPRPDLPVFQAAKGWLDRYFAGEDPGPTPPLLLIGTPFQALVWELLRDIPYGQTRTYGDLAKAAAARLGRPSMSPQAVGNAVGRNPISILVPCHRVVGAAGGLTGYAGGLDRKAALLELEGACKGALPR